MTAARRRTSPETLPEPASTCHLLLDAPRAGRLLITVTGADPGPVREALAGFPLTIRTAP